MKIVVLDGGTTNPGDISWNPLGALGDLTVYDSTPPELVVPRAQEAEALIVNRIQITREILEQLPHLQMIGMLATGYNSIDTAAARERGISVCNVPNYCTASVAQQAFTLLLCLCGNAHQYSKLVREGKWEEAVAMNHGAHPLFELAGKTLGIIGYGSIGKAMANLALSFGMNVLLFSRTKKDAPAGCRWTDLPSLLSESDAVSIHCPFTKETWHLIGKEQLSLMKPTAFLINTSRGGLVDSAALADALNSGRLAGAGLDVLEQEPPLPSDPLLSAKNCVITPHIAWASQEARRRLVDAVAENLKAFQQGSPKNVVN